ncbi:hypothetical protein ACIQPR_49050 [Streptomyces sp. NPDC091280]|uniref:hypothetical protein n=1 Tax=Streptomyces sp. NPDC091280 TaxID=3365984 RepID=UPI0038132C51
MRLTPGSHRGQQDPGRPARAGHGDQDALVAARAAFFDGAGRAGRTTPHREPDPSPVPDDLARLLDAECGRGPGAASPGGGGGAYPAESAALAERSAHRAVRHTAWRYPHRIPGGPAHLPDPIRTGPRTPTSGSC